MVVGLININMGILTLELMLRDLLELLLDKIISLSL
jgi:hypothetical protein